MDSSLSYDVHIGRQMLLKAFGKESPGVCACECFFMSMSQQLPFFPTLAEKKKTGWQHIKKLLKIVTNCDFSLSFSKKQFFIFFYRCHLMQTTDTLSQRLVWMALKVYWWQECFLFSFHRTHPKLSEGYIFK